MSATPSGDLLARSTLVINQKAKLFELHNQFLIFDQQGQQIGRVEQVSQSVFTRLARIFTDLDVVLPVRLEVRADPPDRPVLVLDKPWFRMATTVSRPDGSTLGTISKQIRMGKTRFVVADPSGAQIGVVLAENWRARDFSIRDAGDREVARVTKKWAGFAKEMFTDADNYVVQVSDGVGDPMRSLAIGAALAIDTVMKQKDD